MKKVLTIAGFDGSGGAGIQADLKTFSAFGCYGMQVLTALPVQNTTGVKKLYEIPSAAVVDQLEAIFEDIRPDAIKIGMLHSEDTIDAVADSLKRYAQDIPIVLDPVMVAKSGDSLLQMDAVNKLTVRLLKKATLVTPNVPEAEVLTKSRITDANSMERGAQELLSLGCHAVLLKGGHLPGEHVRDLYVDRDGTSLWLTASRIDTRNTHGTGCTLSAAIASCLALGIDLPRSCEIAKNYLHKAINAARNQTIGHGAGPVHHFYHLWPADGQKDGDALVSFLQRE